MSPQRRRLTKTKTQKKENTMTKILPCILFAVVAIAVTGCDNKKADAPKSGDKPATDAPAKP
jgi:hypothetical protein